MAGELDSLIIRLAAETADAQRQVARMENSVQRFSKNTRDSLGRSDRAFDRMSNNLTLIGNKIIAAFAVGTIVNWTDSVIRATNSTADLADTVGLTTKQFQEMRTLAAQQGMATNQLDVATRGFAVRMGELRGQAGGFYEFLQRHLPTLAAQLQATSSQSEALAVMEQAFERLDSEAHRAALANAAFGEAGLQLAPILAQVGSQIDAAKKAAEDYGTVVSEETIRETRKLQAEVDLMTLKWKKLSAEGIIGAVNALKDWRRMLNLIAGVPLAGLGVKVMTDPAPTEKPAIEAMADRVAGFAAPALQEAVNKQPALVWRMKMRPEQDPSKWKTTVQVGDPFADMLETARRNHAQFQDELREGYHDVASVIGTSLTQPLHDAFSGNLRDTKEYLRTLINGLADAVVQAMLLKPIIEGIKNALAGSGGRGGIGAILGGLMGGLGFRASGGPVSAGKAYVVGERGPELMVPTSSGVVVPNHAMGGGGGTVYNIDARGAAPGVEQRIYETLAHVERTRPTAPAQMHGYNRRYPLRAA